MRLIDADALLDEISVHLERIEQEIEDAPTIEPAAMIDKPVYLDAEKVAEIVMEKLADAVQVVRCKECKHSQYDEVFHMRWCNGDEVKDNDFCSYGERMDGGKK